MKNFLDALSNSGPAVRRYSEGRATGPLEDRYKVLVTRTGRARTLAEESGKTRLTLHVRVLGGSAGPFVPAGMDVGWAECLDRLESFVTKP